MNASVISFAELGRSGWSGRGCSSVGVEWMLVGADCFISLGRGHCYCLDLCVPRGMTSPALENS